jgi:hypothetical protein
MPEEIKIKTKYEFFKTDSKVKANAPESESTDRNPWVWVNAAKEGQVIGINNELFTITREGLESSVGTWKDGQIFNNHNDLVDGFKIYDDKFTSPFLSFLLDEEIAKRVENEGGGSIDALAIAIDDNKIRKMSGIGYSILSKGTTPSCTHEAGCGTILAHAPLADVNAKWSFDEGDYSIDELENACAWKDENKTDRAKEDYKFAFKLPNGTIVWDGLKTAMTALNETIQDVNIPSKDRNLIYNILATGYKLFDKEPPGLNLGIQSDAKNENKGGNKNMADEKREVVFTQEQVAEIKASAIEEVREQLGNEYKVGITDLETAQAAKVKELSDAHDKELETTRATAMKQATLMESVSTKYGLSEEAKKTLLDAKTIEDALTLFSTLEVATAEPVIAAKGGAKKGGGIIMGAGAEGTEKKIRKIEEVGSYDPRTQKWIPTYREEVI